MAILDAETLRGRRALVCGASAGIGRAAALALASLGAEVLALARRGSLLDALVPELLAAGASDARGLVADLDDRPALYKAIEDELKAHGPIHIWINNTGGPPPGPLTAASEADITAALGRHLLSSQGLLQRLLPGMEAAGYGRIINVLSTSVRIPIPGLGVSNLTRAAMASWAKTLAGELPPGLTINCVLPGFTDTERLTALGQSRADARGCDLTQIQTEWRASIPEGRLGEPSEIAAAIAFLASPAGAYIRGVCLPVDGGRTGCI